MVPGRIFALLAICAFPLFCQGDSAVGDKLSFPVPPQQLEAWAEPETKLPPELLSACRDLFDMGFADPRGCEYREVFVQTGRQSEWDQTAGGFKIHGWVLLAQSTASPQFAIGWNGVIYPLVSVGAPANIDADMGKLLAHDSDASPHHKDFDLRYAWNESEELSAEKLTLCKIPILLRLGKVELAQKLWSCWSDLIKTARDPWNEKESTGLDPFILMSRDWLWANFNRAVQAHLSGNPQLALSFVQPIPDLRARLEQKARSRGFAVKMSGSKEKFTRPTLDLTFLEQTPILIEDEKRRVKENATAQNEENNPEAITDKSKRIVRLIHNLQDVVARPFMCPGYTDFTTSPVVRALIKEGEDAVDPLIDCMERDHRLTLSVDQGGRILIQGFYNSRIIGVEEPAFAAIQCILQTRNQFPSLNVPYVNSHPGGELLERTALAAKVREYWKKQRGLTQPQRWYEALRDDQAQPDAWMEAANNIVMADNMAIGYGFGSLLFQPVHRPHKPGEPEPIVFRGEELRGKTNPSVSELLAKRLRESMDKKYSKQPFPYEAPKKLAMALAKWDGKHQIETLRWYSGELEKIVCEQGEHEGSGAINDLVTTYLERVDAGDPQALGDYAKWVRSADPKTLHAIAKQYSPLFFAPLWCYPHDPVMIETANWLFLDPQSTWSLESAYPDKTWTGHAASLPLVGLPAFRSILVKQLCDKQVIGKVEITASHQFYINCNVASDSGSQMADDLPVGTKRNFRLCDAISYSVSKIRGAPECEPYWTTARRDRAVPETIQFLKRYGDRLIRKTEAHQYEYYYDQLRERLLSFSPLDHPATQAEVVSGNAIFSMEGKGERKICPLPEIPMRAKWIKLKDYQNIGFGYDEATKKNTIVKSFDQDGTVWQAEDILVNGKWKRYFGFIGRNCMAAVPAEEIQFDDNEFTQNMNGWGIRLDLFKTQESRELFQASTTKLGKAIPVTISVKNLAGIKCSLPKTKAAPRMVNSADLGIKIHMEFCPHSMRGMSVFSRETKWETVAAKSPQLVNLLPTPTALEPFEKTALLEFDLSKLYELSKPGTYRMNLEFIQDTLLGTKGTIYASFFELLK